MTKNLLSAIFISLLSTLAVACGDAGTVPIEGEPGFGEELDAGNGAEGNVDENEANEDEEVVDDQDEEIDEEPGIDGPFCGDGFVDDDEECDDGNERDDDGCSSVCEVEVFEGETQGEIAIDLIVDDLNSNEEPLEAGCTGEIAVAVNNRVLVGEGRCFLPANFLDYTVDADVDEDGTVEGGITIVLNNRPNVLPLAGSLDNGFLSLRFDGVTLLVANIRGVWDGTIEADFD